MTRALAALVAVTAVGWTLSPCLAEEAPAKSVAAVSAVQPANAEYGPFAALPTTVKLTEDQQKKIKALVAETNKELQADKEKLQKLGAELAKANTAGKKDEVRAIQMQISMLAPKVQKGEAALTNKVLAALTAEQKAAWDTFCIRQVATQRLTDIKLTDDQKKKIDGICADCAVEMGKITDRSNSVAVMKVYQAATEKVQNVLTDEQKKSVQIFVPATLPATIPAPPKTGGG